MTQQTVRHPLLLPEHTFVVQLHPTTQVEGGQVTGRIEHLVSRQATMFESLDSLLAFDPGAAGGTSPCLGSGLTSLLHCPSTTVL